MSTTRSRVTGSISDIERRRLKALVAADVDLARSLHSDDYQLITPGGGSLSREEYLGGIESGNLDYLVFEPASDIAERAYDQVAVVRYKARIEILVSGERDTGLFWHTDFYEFKDERWQAVWSQATQLPEPRGDDKHA